MKTERLAKAKQQNPALPPGVRWMTKEQLAAALQFSERHITELTRAKIIPHVKFGTGPAGDIRYDWDKVVAALEAKYGVPAAA